MRCILSTFVLLLLAVGAYSQNCTPSFSVNQTTSSSGYNLLNVSLGSVSTPSTTHQKRFTIDWGDGTIMNTYATPSLFHNYSSPGTYSVKLVLRLTDSLNNILYCIDSTTHNVTVAYAPCATLMNASVSMQTQGLVTFTANNPAGTSNMTYIWNYGDGHADTTTSSTITHTYSYSGLFTAQLTASNGTCVHTNTKTFYVSNGCGAAQYSYTTNNLTAYFSNQSTVLQGSVSMQSSWDFGDGTTSLSTSPNHTYSTAGTYNAQLITTYYDSTTSQAFCNDTVVKAITVTGTTAAPSAISGYIAVDTGLTTTQVYRVWLIQYNSTNQTLTAIDTLTITNTPPNRYTQFSFANVTPGSYRVKAAILNAQALSIGYVPTYHDSALLWNNATIINHTVSGSNNVKILMQHGTPTTGPGFVGGNVTQGANKGTANGIPDLNVFILDASGNLVQSAITDASGNYSFSQLPNGTYSIYPEEMEYRTTPSTIIISNNQSSISNINFERSKTMKTITPKATGVTNVNTDDNWFSIHPNPAGKYVIVNWQNTNTATTGLLNISDVTGRTIYSTTVRANTKEQIQLDHLNSGVYFVTIDANNNRQTQKLIIK